MVGCLLSLWKQYLQLHGSLYLSDGIEPSICSVFKIRFFHWIDIPKKLNARAFLTFWDHISSLYRLCIFINFSLAKFFFNIDK